MSDGPVTVARRIQQADELGFGGAAYNLASALHLLATPNCASAAADKAALAADKIAAELQRIDAEERNDCGRGLPAP